MRKVLGHSLVDHIRYKILLLHSSLIQIVSLSLVFVVYQVVTGGQAFPRKLLPVENIAACESWVAELCVPFPIFVRTVKSCCNVFRSGELIIDVESPFIGTYVSTFRVSAYSCLTTSIMQTHSIFTDPYFVIKIYFYRAVEKN